MNRKARGRTTGGALGVLSVVPRTVASATSEARRSVGKIRPSLPRWVDPHPGIALLIAAAIIASVCFLYVSQVTNVSNANYKLHDLESDFKVLQRDQDDLRLKIAGAQALTTIADKAAHKLQMVPLGDHFSYLTLADGPLTSVEAQPTPALATLEP